MFKLEEINARVLFHGIRVKRETTYAISLLKNIEQESQARDEDSASQFLSLCVFLKHLEI